MKDSSDGYLREHRRRRESISDLYRQIDRCYRADDETHLGGGGVEKSNSKLTAGAMEAALGNNGGCSLHVGRTAQGGIDARDACDRDWVVGPLLGGGFGNSAAAALNAAALALARCLTERNL